MACMPGTFKDVSGSAACRQCSVGKYTPHASAVRCLQCPLGLSSGEGSVGVTECVCPGGFRGSGLLGEGLIEVPGISASLLSAIDSSRLLPAAETDTARQVSVFYDSTGCYSAARHGNSNDAATVNTSDAPWQYDFTILVLYAGLSASEHDQGQEAGGNGLTDGCEENVDNVCKAGYASVQTIVAQVVGLNRLANVSAGDEADINGPSSFQQLSPCVRTCAQVACAREKAAVGSNGSSLLASSVCSVR